MYITIIGLIALFIFKFDIQIKSEWDGYYLIYKNTKRDLISGEYYEIYYSKKILTKKQ